MKVDLLFAVTIDVADYYIRMHNKFQSRNYENTEVTDQKLVEKRQNLYRKYKMWTETFATEYSG